MPGKGNLQHSHPKAHAPDQDSNVNGLRVLILIVALCLANPSTLYADSRASQGLFQTVALSGQGDFTGTVFSFTDAVINDFNEVSFEVRIFEGQSGVWTTTGGNGLHATMIIGTQAPGYSPGTVFDSLSVYSPLNNNASQVVFQATVSGSEITKANDRGIWVESAGGVLELLAAEGLPAPGTADASFKEFNSVHTGNSGHVVFSSYLAGPTIDTTNLTGVWAQDELASLRKVARAGEIAPGTGNPYATHFQPVVNASGHVAISSSVISNTETLSGIWAEGHGSGLELVAMEGDALPALPPGVTLGSLSSGVAFNDAGNVAFHSRFEGAGVDSSNRYGLLAQSPDESIRLVAREGDDAPGLGGGERFDGLSELHLNDAGDTVFVAHLTGPGVDSTNDTAIYSESDGLEPRLIVREGAIAPGTEPGLTLTNFGANWGFQYNNNGQLLFSAFLQGPGLTSDNDEGIFVETTPGELDLLIREGDVLEVQPGDFRTVEQLRTSRTGRRLNDSGNFVVSTRFTDGSEAVLIIPVPEPSAISMASIGLLLLSVACISKGRGISSVR